MHVIIVGAGVAGLTLAQSLRKQGIPFEVFERDVDKDARFQGWAILIHSIIDQLRAVFPADMPDLKESTNHLAPLDLPAQMVYYYGNREGRFGFQESEAFPMVRAERAKLRDWLLTGISVQWGKHATRVEHDDQGATVHFADGTSAKGDLVVGSDGASSVVRESLLQKPSSALLNVVPLSAIVGEVALSGDAFLRQLSLGYSAYNLINPELGFIGFVGLHRVRPDGRSGDFYWMVMQPDEGIGSPDHWLRSSTREEKLDHVLRTVAALSPPLREIFHLTPAEGVRKDLHVWKDLELDKEGGEAQQQVLPSGRVVILGDAAHAMTPAAGQGAFHAIIDAIKLGQVLIGLNASKKSGGVDLDALKRAVSAFNGEMLQRGAQAVRGSRASYEQARKRAATLEHFVEGLRPIPSVRPEDIPLPKKVEV